MIKEAMTDLVPFSDGLFLFLSLFFRFLIGNQPPLLLFLSFLGHSLTLLHAFVRPLPHGTAPLKKKGHLDALGPLKPFLPYYQSKRRQPMRLDVSDHYIKHTKRQCNKGPSVPIVKEQDEAEVLPAHTSIR